MFNKLYGPLDIKTDFDSTTILIANVNGSHRSKDIIEDLANSYCPMFVWLMDTRKKWNPPKDYHLVMERNFHKNCLWIRNDIQKGRVISRTPFGIQVDNMTFRYIPPQSKEEKIYWKEVEMGDYNFLSNKWINLENVTVENRMNKPVGSGYATKKKYQFKFFNIKSDHDSMWIKMNKIRENNR